ncbi:1560_t:CDS:2, partial [Racocetra fulgida]
DNFTEDDVWAEDVFAKDIHRDVFVKGIHKDVFDKDIFARNS